MAGGRSVTVGLLDPAGYLSSEVGLEEFLIQYYLVHLLHIGQRKILRHKAEGDIGILNLVPEPFYAIGDDPGMVKGYSPRIFNRLPPAFLRLPGYALVLLKALVLMRSVSLLNRSIVCPVLVFCSENPVGYREPACIVSIVACLVFRRLSAKGRVLITGHGIPVGSPGIQLLKVHVVGLLLKLAVPLPLPGSRPSSRIRPEGPTARCRDAPPA